MKKPFIKWISAGMIACILGTGIGAGQAGYQVTYAATNTAVAALYAQIQKERAAEVVALVNQIRVEAGLKPLTVHTNLTKMAKTKAVEMYNRNYFNHTSPVYGSPFEMMDAFNITYRYAGENIAKGQWSAKEVVQDWMDSPGHKANILNKNYNLIGVGYYNGYWVQEFIGTGK
ncbi:CAP domain-containing protein [Paenibacillus brevis]